MKQIIKNKIKVYQRVRDLRACNFLNQIFDFERIWEILIFSILFNHVIKIEKICAIKLSIIL